MYKFILIIILFPQISCIRNKEIQQQDLKHVKLNINKISDSLIKLYSIDYNELRIRDTIPVIKFNYKINKYGYDFIGWENLDSSKNQKATTILIFFDPIEKKYTYELGYIKLNDTSYIKYIYGKPYDSMPANNFKANLYTTNKSFRVSKQFVDSVLIDPTGTVLK